MLKQFILASFLGISTISYGQKVISTHKVFDNTQVGVVVGGTSSLKFDEPIRPTVGLKFLKYFQPSFGVEIEGTGWLGKDWTGVPSSGRTFKATNVSVSPKINLTNLFGQPRNLEFSTITGLGWMHKKGENTMSSNLGLEVLWKVAKNWHFYVEPSLIYDLGKEVQFNSNKAQLALQAGVNYVFKNADENRGFTRYNIDDYNNQINALRNELSAKPKEVIITDTVTFTKNDTILVGEYTVFFAFDSYILSDDAKKTLDGIKFSKVVVAGYASPEGDPNHNTTLSKLRALEVANYLTGKVEVMEIKSLGAATQESNRVVIIEEWKQ